ncbi:hypothetical protein [Novosphingobium sp. KN65.2]|uniref:hypothetical protein n=1 Tax=Novosphingobium sp. KN65.2 TaxID=1478134 RepID=UPI0005E3D0BA|nr:hypothetical protein [Novosphingobium sp. KN65.2]CDO34040.1 hypothetical protein SPHV1_100074 [Novosphingobium sp. KN65.2]
MHILAELTPLDPTDGSRPVLRVSSSGRDRDLAGYNSERWWPAIVEKPKFSIRLFDGDFTGDVSVAQGGLTVRLDVLAVADPNAARYVWAGAGVVIYIWSSGTATQVFNGKVTGFGSSKNRLELSIEVDTEPFKVDVLGATYAGTTGIEGGADLKGRVKPWVLGRAANIEPVLIDTTNYVYQVSAYGPIDDVTALYERGSSFGASSGDYADYDALVAASLPEGAWATSLAYGLIRLGAPAYGLITADVDGDSNGGTFWRKTGEIIERVADALSIDSGLIQSSSLTALDTDVPYNINLYLTEQISFYDLVVALARPCNAVAGVDFLGKIFVTRVVFDTAGLTLDVQGRQWPPVGAATEQPVTPPYKRIVFGADRCWRVHSLDEITFYAPLIDMGLWNAATIYREGNIVHLADETRWIYINTTPSAANAPVAGSAYWASLTGDEGISTERWPADPPTDWVIGSIYYGEDNHPYRFEGLELYCGSEQLFCGSEPLLGSGYVSVRDKNLTEIIASLQSVDDDSILTIDEKIRIVIPENARLEAQYQGALARANLMGLNVTPMTDARSAWIALRDSLSPAWDDTSQNTSITREDWDTILSTYRAAIEDANTTIATPGSITVVPPPAQTVALDSDGAIESGEYPRTLTPTVKRGETDIRDDDDVSYSITTSGITATVNNTSGSADKGKITATDGSSGYIDLTVTTGGVAFGPYRILFTEKAVPIWSGTGTSGKTELGNGLVLTWKEFTVSANASAEFETYGDGHEYTTFAHAWLSGGEGGANAQDNNPYVDFDAGGDTLTGAYISSARDNAHTNKLFSIGI